MRKSNIRTNSEKTRMLTTLGILSALIIVLQYLCAVLNSAAILPFTLTLALPPIIIGAAIYEKKGGAVLGFVFGLAVALFIVTGIDKTGAAFLQHNAFATVFLCVLKSTAAGFVAGVLYPLIAKKNSLVAAFVTGIVCPTVNTGIFVIGSYIFFSPVFGKGGFALLYTLVVAVVLINYLVELGVNLVLSPAIDRIIKIQTKTKNRG